MMKSRGFLSGWILAGVSFAFPLAFQEPQPKFRVEVNYVEVDARVTDGRGDFVGDLGPEDFELFEDGIRQEIASFKRVSIPTEEERPSAPELSSVEPDVRTNEGSGEGRLYVLVLDDLHTAAERSGRVRRIARQFLDEGMQNGDLVAVTQTSGSADASQGFTDNRRMLSAAVEKFRGQKLRSATLEKIERDEDLPKGQQGMAEFNVGDPLDSERGLQARKALAHLRSVSELLRNIRGRRKAVLYISEGIDYDIRDVFGSRYAESVIGEARAVLGEANRHGISIYALDPRGLEPVGEGLVEVGHAPPSFAERQPFPASNDPRYREQRGMRQENTLGTATTLSEQGISHDSLAVLAEETGGSAFYNQGDFEKGLRRIVEENSRYYLLGYYPTNPAADGRFRPIEVRVKRPGLTVRARKGYVTAGAGSKAAEGTELTEASSEAFSTLVGTPVPVPGLTLRAFAAPLDVAPGRASVAVVVETATQGFRFTEKDGKLHDEVDIWMIAFDAGGGVVAYKNNTYGLAVRSMDTERMLADGFRSMAVLELPAGNYQLRVGAHESGAGQTGSVFYDLEIPEWTSSTLLMSGLLLTSTKEAGVPVASLEEERRRVPLTPTTRRTFTASDTLQVYVQVYDSSSKPAPLEVELEILIRTVEGSIAFKSGEVRKREEPTSAPLVLWEEISLAGLKPGTYALEVHARGREDAQTERKTLFEVVEAPTIADPVPIDSDLVAAYLDLVNSYRHGDHGNAKTRLAGWTVDATRRAVDNLSQQLSDISSVKSAILLHTELALFGEEGLSYEARSRHLLTAKQWVNLISGEPAYHPFLRDWNLSLACFSHGGDLSQSVEFLQEAMRLFPDDAVLLLALGSTYEVSSWVNQDRDQLGKAEEYYRRALHFDQNLEEAHLRLGRVLQLRGGKREEESLQALHWVVDNSDDSYLLYLAHLFLGDHHMAREEHDAAIRSYRAAHEMAPQWQTAYLSLSQALHASGNLDGAAETLHQALELPVSQPSYLDGFRLYRLGQMGMLPDLLEKMRQEVSR